MKFKLLLLLLACKLTTACSGQSFSKAKMDTLLDMIATKNKAMLSIALCQDGKIVYSKAIGYSNISASKEKPATTLTRYRIGSVTKVFTSVMIFQLIEEGKLSLDDKLSRFFPDLPDANKITIANMLNHSSGLHNFTNDSDYATILNEHMTEREMLHRFAQQKSDFEPGSKHQYSNTNFVLLGYIVETLDHKTYHYALKDRILKKAGLTQTYYGRKINPCAGEATSYKWENDWVPATETDMSIPGGAGALVSTPTELTRFITALFNGELITSSSLEKMITINGGYGMDLVAYNFDGKTGYGHNGGIDGFESQLVYYPKEKLATAYIANGVNTSLNKMMQGVLCIYFNKPYKLPGFNTIPVTPAELNTFAGSYSSPDISFALKFTKVDGTLIAQFSDDKDSLYLSATATNTFSYDHYELVFIFDPALKQVKMVSGDKTFILKKVDG